MNREGIAGQDGEIPAEMKAALEANGQLQQALAGSGLPTRFSAMVLGLATLKRLNEERDRQSETTDATARKNSTGWGVLS